MTRLFFTAGLFALFAVGDDSPRPVYHFTPPQNWMNDPNGAVYFDGEYHLFYQHNSFANTWGHMSWGHAVSRDLVYWEHPPLALAEEKGGMIFSGSSVVDDRNTSGFCLDGRPCLVAIYTGHTEARQNQHLAFSNDRGRTWTKYSGNPVLDLGLKEFRDPKVFWHAASKRWVMVVSLAVERKVRFFASTNLREWQALSDFGAAGAATRVWECPDLFPLPIAGEPGRQRWVLSISVNPGGPAGGSANQYFVGNFDGAAFANDNPSETTLWADYGRDFYASTSFSNIPAVDGRRIWIGWFSNWDYARLEPTTPWRTAQTVPRELQLKRTSAGLRLVQQPVRELANSRRDVVVLRDVTMAEANRKLTGFHSQSFEVELELSGEGGLDLLKGPGGGTLAGVDAEGHPYLDRSNSGQVDFHQTFAARHRAPRAATPALRVLVDRSSVELFAGGGQAVISDRVFPPAGSDGLELFGARDVRVKLLRVATIQ